MLANILLLAVTTAIALFITAVVFVSRTVRTATKFAFGLTTVNMALWNITIYIADNVQANLVFWNSLVFLFPSIAAVGLFLLVSLFAPSALGRKRIVAHSSITWAVLSISIVAQLLAILSGQIFTTIRYTSDGTYEFTRGPMYLVYVLGVLVLLGIISASLIRNYRRSDKHSQQRRALKVVMLTILALLGYSVITNIVIPVVTGSQQFISLGTFSLDIFSFGLALSIVRYRLFDIRLFVVRAVAYVSSALTITLIFITPFILLLNQIFRANLSVGQIILGVILSACFLYLVMYLRRYFDKVTARLFFRGYYDPQDVLDKLSDILVHTADFEALRENTASVLKEVLNPEFLRYALLAEEDKLADRLYKYSQMHQLSIVDTESVTPLDAGIHALREENVTLAVKLRTTHEDLGFIVLGHKQSGEVYTERDKKLLSIAADEVAISLQNVLRFEQIQRFNVTLQEEVDSKTRELRRKNRRLEELDDIKDDFISMASHQLRTPLTSVKGYLSMVIEGDAGKLNDTQSQMLRQAFTSSQRMVFLITDLLNVSRLKTGKFVIDAAPARLDEIVGQELEQLYETAQVKDLDLIFDRPAAFPELMLDEVKIRQVIMNFVDNAIYYTPAGGHITIELSEKQNAVELRVIDDGIGVPKGEQHHLFTKFYRATNARKARPDGTGLGLFMAQKVIVAQGGSVIFSSQENKGSTFGFSLPKARLAVPASLKSDSTSKVALPVKEPVAAK